MNLKQLINASGGPVRCSDIWMIARESVSRIINRNSISRELIDELKEYHEEQIKNLESILNGTNKVDFSISERKSNRSRSEQEQKGEGIIKNFDIATGKDASCETEFIKHDDGKIEVVKQTMFDVIEYEWSQENGCTTECKHSTTIKEIRTMVGSWQCKTNCPHFKGHEVEGKSIRCGIKYAKGEG